MHPLGRRTTRPLVALVATLSLGAGALTLASPAAADDAPAPQGASVEADSGSPTGYTVTFTYRNPNATQVRLGGDLTLLGLTSGTTRYQPEEWQQGRYHAGGVEFLRDMERDADGTWSVSVPLHAGNLSYWYRVWDPSQGWTNKRIWDPASTNPRPPGDQSFRVRNNDVLDSVAVPYDEKQADPVLKARATYELPRRDAAERGTVQYVPYTTILGDSGHYLGVYLPPGYDPDRAEPYKVAYLAHGIFGDETDFMIPVGVPTILDNMTARGEIEPTVVVTMGNHFTGTSLGFGSYNQPNAANNLVQTILPFVEDRYNVATDREGRAYAGFSYGGMTGGVVMKSYPTTFGYYGFFSGNPSLTAADYDSVAAAVGRNGMSVFLGNGVFEGNLNAQNAIAGNFAARGIHAATAQVPGAHDGMTAGQLFTQFARDHLWKPTGVVGMRNVTDVGSYGQQVVATVLEYADEVDASSLSPEDFVLRDTQYNFRFDDISTLGDLVERRVTDVYTTADPALLADGGRHEGPGRFVVLEVEPDLEAGWTTVLASNPQYVRVNPKQPTVVTQVGDVVGADGSVLSYGGEQGWTVTDEPVDRRVAQFEHGVLESPTGQPLHYDYRLPDGYDPSKRYPLVVALPGYGQGYDGSSNLGVHLTTDMLAHAWSSSEWLGRDEDVIVLAPQNRRISTATDGPQTAQLVEQFSADFAVDPDRVYATSISYGSTLMWWLFANRPELFAGGLLTGGFPNTAAQATAIAAAEVPMWITHGTGDHLLRVANARASYQRLVDAYRARGFTDAAIADLVRWTEYGDEAFTLPDRHLAAAPTLEDPTTMQWLLDQRRRLDVHVGVDTRCVGKNVRVTPTVTNREDVPVSAVVTTDFGTKRFTNLQPGRGAFHPFTVPASSVDAGTVTVTVTADIGGTHRSTAFQVVQPAVHCG